MEISQATTLACLLEATARKAGNVHPGHEFEGLTYFELVASGVAIGPVLERAADQSLGETILQAVQATRSLVETNSNLGIILLLAPLAATRVPLPTVAQVTELLERTTVRDAALVYEAIRLAVPGGMGEVADQDIQSTPSVTLLEAMKLAQDRDCIARQYATGFRDILQSGFSSFAESLEKGWPLEAAIAFCHVTWMANFPDSLICRKLGAVVASESLERARAVARAWPSHSEARDRGTWRSDNYDRFDEWLRGDGHRRNPGTSADLVTATVFLALRRGLVEPQRRWNFPVPTAPVVGPDAR